MDTPTKEQLKLIKWANDGYPPIDLNNELRHVIALIKDFKSQQATIERLEELLIDKEILLEAAKNGCDQRDSTIERQSKLLEAADKVINLCDKPNPEFSVKGLPETFDQYLKEYTSMKSQQTQDNGGTN